MSDLTPDAEKSRQTKVALRARLLTTRRSLSVAAREVAARQVQDHILALVRRTGARSIAAYVPVGSEPGGPNLPARFLSALPPGGRLLLPVLLPDNDLTWAELTPPPSSATPTASGALPASPGPFTPAASDALATSPGPLTPAASDALATSPGPLTPAASDALATSPGPLTPA
ncbi:5-formyltetrahydrofolate cyclo-ligase, partial [Actinoplanes philippinensis]|uniref:5-formyltetrahydrofolate cyclo-ligase n=1 Tax=Actinoplanes philippinensis TaxID=35752 RepID=UPI0033ECC812